MSRAYRTTVESADYLDLRWGALDDNSAPITWASGTIYVLGADQTTVIVTAAASLADPTVLAWRPAGMPDIGQVTQYFVRWKAVDAGGRTWYSRPLIPWIIEPLP